MKTYFKKKHVEAGELRRKEVVEVSPFSDTPHPPDHKCLIFACLVFVTSLQFLRAWHRLVKGHMQQKPYMPSGVKRHDNDNDETLY